MKLGSDKQLGLGWQLDKTVFLHRKDFRKSLRLKSQADYEDYENICAQIHPGDSH